MRTTRTDELENNTVQDNIQNKLYKVKKFIKRHHIKIITTLLVIAVLLQVFLKDTTNNYEQQGGKIGMAMKALKLSGASGASSKGLGSIGGKGLGSIGSKGMGGIMSSMNYISERKQDVANFIYTIISFLLIFLIFMPTASLLLIIMLSLYLIKPKIAYLKSL